MPNEKEKEELQENYEGIKPLSPEFQYKGTDVPRVSFENLSEFIETISSRPTHTPRNIFEQLKVWSDGTNATLCVYDNSADAWQYIILNT